MHEEDVFSAKTLGKTLFHCQNDWFGNGPAGQFWLGKRPKSDKKLVLCRGHVPFPWGFMSWPLAREPMKRASTVNFFSNENYIFWSWIKANKPIKRIEEGHFCPEMHAMAKNRQPLAIWIVKKDRPSPLDWLFERCSRILKDMFWKG